VPLVFANSVEIDTSGNVQQSGGDSDSEGDDDSDDNDGNAYVEVSGEGHTSDDTIEPSSLGASTPSAHNPPSSPSALPLIDLDQALVEFDHLSDASSSTGTIIYTPFASAINSPSISFLQALAPTPAPWSSASVASGLPFASLTTDSLRELLGTEEPFVPSLPIDIPYPRRIIAPARFSPASVWPEGVLVSQVCFCRNHVWFCAPSCFQGFPLSFHPGRELARPSFVLMLTACHPSAAAAVESSTLT